MGVRMIDFIRKALPRLLGLLKPWNHFQAVLHRRLVQLWQDALVCDDGTCRQNISAPGGIRKLLPQTTRPMESAVGH